MRKLHKGLIIGGATLAVLVPAGLVAADQVGPGNGHGRGNGTMDHDCDQDQIQARDGTGPMHATNSANSTNRMGGPPADRPMDGTGNQARGDR